MTPQERRMLEMMAQVGNVGLGDTNMSMMSQLLPYDEDKFGNTNTYQDRIQMLMDPMTGALSGFGGMTPEAFDPIYERTPVEAPGAQMLNQWSSSSEGSARWLMGNLIAEGIHPDEAYSILREEIQSDPEGIAARTLPPDLIDTYNSRPGGEPVTTPGSGLQSLYEQALELSANLSTDPTGFMTDSNTGGFYTETETPSDIATQFAEAGLPNPYEEYTPETFGYRGQTQGQVDELAGLDVQRDQQRAAMQRLMEQQRNAPSTGQSEWSPDAPGNNSPTPSAPSTTTVAPAPTGKVLRGTIEGGGFLDGVRGEIDKFGNDLEALGRWGSKATGLDPWIGKADEQIGKLSSNVRGSTRPLQGSVGNRQRQDPRESQRALQRQMFQGIRDRQEIGRNRDPREVSGNLQANKDAAVARIMGRTPFNDAVQQRMLAQQLAGF